MLPPSLVIFFVLILRKGSCFLVGIYNSEVCLYQELLILQLVPQQEICVRSNFIFIESIMIKATMLFLIMITLLLRNSTRVLCIRSNITPPPAVSALLRILLPSYCSSLSSSSLLRPLRAFGRPRVDRRALLQLRWVHLWVFSTSCFTPSALSSEGGGGQACGCQNCFNLTLGI